MTTMIVPIVLLVLVGGFMALVVLGAQDRSSRVGNGQFDERQLIAQGKGYKLGFFVMVTAAFAVFIAEAILQRELLGAGDALVIDACLGTAVMSVYCIVKDAYISMRAVKGSGVVNLIIMGLLWTMSVLQGVQKMEEDGLFMDGRLGRCWVYFAVALLAAAVFIGLLVKMLMVRRNRE